MSSTANQITPLPSMLLKQTLNGQLEDSEEYLTKCMRLESRTAPLHGTVHIASTWPSTIVFNGVNPGTTTPRFFFKLNSLAVPPGFSNLAILRMQYPATIARTPCKTLAYGQYAIKTVSSFVMFLRPHQIHNQVNCCQD